MSVDVHGYYRLPEDDRDRVVSWLKDHGLNNVSECRVENGHLVAHVYKVNADGKKYMVNCQGKTKAEEPDHRHMYDYGDGQVEMGSSPASCWHAAMELRSVPLKSEPPVPV